MDITELKTIIGVWLLSQIFITPFIFIENGKVGLVVDFGALALLIITYFGLKLICV